MNSTGPGMTSASDLVELTAENLRLVLAPAVGGSIVRFDVGNFPVMRGANGTVASPLEAANFPLVPYCNRIRGGAFTFRGREVRIAPNMRGDPSPLHGQGWAAPWTVVDTTAQHARLAYDHPPGEWPWRYRAEQHFALGGAGLDLVLTCANLSDNPMPCGLGQHPYFPCNPRTRLRTEVRTAWTIDQHVLPVEEVAASGRYDLSDRLVCGQDLDNGFGGWGGVAQIDDPDHPFTLRLLSEDAAFFQLYSPASGGLFVAEPVTHANAALNAPEPEWRRLGMRVLEPGESMQLKMRLEVRPRPSHAPTYPPGPSE